MRYNRAGHIWTQMIQQSRAYMEQGIYFSKIQQSRAYMYADVAVRRL